MPIDPIRAAAIPPAAARIAPSPGAGSPESIDGIAEGDRAATAGATDFQSVLLNSLEEVNRLQQQAAAGTSDLFVGRTDNVAEVMGRVRKAEVAFTLMMEIRNKLIDAYSEIRQMRV